MPLRYLFLDMNAYFASVEQHDRPELRHRPVAVVPSLVDTTCCIAASYEAKRFGIRTGTAVHEARRLCPGLQFVQARPALYVLIHEQIKEAVETCLPIGTVMSIDEMACPLLGQEQEPRHAEVLARRVKEAIRRDVGPALRCSVGLGPNVLLAKVATDMQKPDGLTIIRSEDLPSRLFGLKLDDLPGIGRQMLKRLNQSSIHTIEQLCQLDRSQLQSIWGSSVLADRWYRRLRGEDVPEPPTQRRTVSHSRILPPDQRDEESARAVLSCLVHKCAARLRSLGYWAGGMSLSIAYRRGDSWQAKKRFSLCRDTLTLLEVLALLWDQRPPGSPFQVGVWLDHLVDARNASMPLFAEERDRSALADAMDTLNRQFGRHTVYFGSMFGAERHASSRIAFTNIPRD